MMIYTPAPVCMDMPRVVDPFRILTPQLIATPPPATPSTSFAIHDLATASLFLPPVLPPAMLHQPPSYASLFGLHSMPHVQSAERIEEVDVVNDLPSSEYSSNISLSIIESIAEDKNEPLDLSIRKTTPSPSPSRPSVIIDCNSPKASSSSIRRSVSSVSQSDSDMVKEHFRRSLSGKWPRRQKTDDEKARASPFGRRKSFNTHAPVTTSTVSVINGNLNASESIEDHFRRSLAVHDFQQWQKKRGATVDAPVTDELTVPLV